VDKVPSLPRSASHSERPWPRSRTESCFVLRSQRRASWSPRHGRNESRPCLTVHPPLPVLKATGGKRTPPPVFPCLPPLAYGRAGSEVARRRRRSSSWATFAQVRLDQADHAPTVLILPFHSKKNSWPVISHQSPIALPVRHTSDTIKKKRTKKKRETCFVPTARKAQVLLAQAVMTRIHTGICPTGRLSSGPMEMAGHDSSRAEPERDT
jgi:hypothetical protein